MEPIEICGGDVVFVRTANPHFIMKALENINEIRKERGTVTPYFLFIDETTYIDSIIKGKNKDIQIIIKMEDDTE